MSLVATEPQPALAWSFESSNVDYITGLSPNLSTAGTYAAPTGGTITTVGSNRIHTFTTVGTTSITFLVPVTIQLLVVAGGGGGGGSSTTSAGGGGGAGEYYYNATYSVTPGTYTVTVGNFGAGGDSVTNVDGGDGGVSVFDIISANGGGGGSTAGNGTGGRPGGSGGGCARGFAGVGGASTKTPPGLGNKGGDNANSSNFSAGGGGGSGSAGAAATASGTAAIAAGSGTLNSISGASVTYTTGGRGGARNGTYSVVVGVNGLGEGGDGAPGGTGNAAVSGARGGSGVVVIAYTSALYPAPTYVAGKYQRAINFNNQTAGAGANSFVSYDVSSFNLTSNSSTLSLWLNPSYTYPLSAGSNPYYIHLQGTTYYSFQTETGLLSNISLHTGSSPSIIVGRAAQSGVWNHYCGVFSNVGTTGASNTASYFYLNGALIGSGNTLSQSFTDLYLASQRGIQNGAWCSIDDVRLYNTALTATQVLSVYKQQGVPGRFVLSPPSPQPALAWLFDGTTTDYVTGLPPSSTFGTSSYVAGIYNQAINFNNPGGTSANYIGYTLTSSFSPTNFTWAHWVNFGQIPVLFVEMPVYFSDSLSSTIQLRVTLNPAAISGSGVKPYIFNGTTAQNLYGPTLSQGVWYHFCVVLTPGAGGSTATLYVNGVSYGSTVLTNDQAAIINNMYVGSQAGANGAICSIDDLRVYNTVLTTPQIQEIYNSSGMPSRQVFTGAPLFSQLSAAAASSAVGAFSLRAVNGVTAKAVAVQGRPVVQWPPAAMTSNTTALSGQVYGNGTYIASSSNGCVVNQNQEFRAFDNDTVTYYEQNYPTGQTYDASGNLLVPTQTQTTVSTATVQGEWLQIQLPTTVTLRSYTIVPRTTFENRCPRIFWIAGSTNGTTWSNVHFQTGITGYTNPTGITFTIPQTSNAVPYNYYRVIVNAIVGTGTNTIMNIASWNLYGEAAAYVTRPTTDFWADSLGNLLTAPVTGQLLQDWLGGTLGYAMTWYDQSGIGNNATGSGSAIYKTSNVNMQWAIQSGSLLTVPSPSNFITNSNFTIHSITRRTTPTTSAGQAIYGHAGSGTESFNKIIAIYSTNNRLALQSLNPTQYTVISNTGCGAYSAAGPVDYLSVIWNGTTPQMYYNGSTSASLAPATFGNIPVTSSFGLLGANAYGSVVLGEFGEIIVFNTALSAADISTLYLGR